MPRFVRGYLQKRKSGVLYVRQSAVSNSKPGKGLIMSEKSISVCLNHPETPAVARCAVCGKPVCGKCLVTRNGVQYCSDRCAAMAESRKADVGMVMESRKKVDSARRIRSIVILVVLIAAVAAGYCFYRNNRKEIDRVIRKTEQQVGNTAREARDSIKSGIPKDSSYKRDRENLVK